MAATDPKRGQKDDFKGHEIGSEEHKAIDTLYHNESSFFSQVARLAFAEKGAEYRSRSMSIHGGHHEQACHAPVDPSGLVGSPRGPWDFSAVFLRPACCVLAPRGGSGAPIYRFGTLCRLPGCARRRAAAGRACPGNNRWDRSTPAGLSRRSQPADAARASSGATLGARELPRERAGGYYGTEVGRGPPASAPPAPCSWRAGS